MKKVDEGFAVSKRELEFLLECAAMKGWTEGRTLWVDWTSGLYVLAPDAAAGLYVGEPGDDATPVDLAELKKALKGTKVADDLRLEPSPLGIVLRTPTGSPVLQPLTGLRFGFADVATVFGQDRADEAPLRKVTTTPRLPKLLERVGKLGGAEVAACWPATESEPLRFDLATDDSTATVLLLPLEPR